MSGQLGLLNIACAAKAKSRRITMVRYFSAYLWYLNRTEQSPTNSGTIRVISKIVRLCTYSCVTNRTPASWPSDLCNQLYNYRLILTSIITVTVFIRFFCLSREMFQHVMTFFFLSFIFARIARPKTSLQVLPLRAEKNLVLEYLYLRYSSCSRLFQFCVCLLSLSQRV